MEMHSVAQALTRVATAALITVALAACSGGGGGSAAPAAPSPSVPTPTTPTPTTPTPSVPTSPKPDSEPQLTLELGTPSTNPIVLPPSAAAMPVQFLSVASGTYYPEQLVVDEVDKQGKLITPSIVLLKDDGEQSDASRGDRTYSGTTKFNSVTSVERFFRVRGDNNGEQVVSGVGRFWVSGCPSRARPSNSEKAALDSRTGTYLFTDEVTVTVAEDVPPELGTINSLLAEVQGRVVGCIPALRQYLVEFAGDQTANGVYNAIDVLQEKPEIVSASPNGKILDLPKNAVNTCDGTECQWYLERIRAPEAWNMVGGGDEQQAVAVIDFGVDCNHPELECDGNVYNQDAIDHGTGVAGLIGARNGDGSNLVGVAWNTKLHPYSFIGVGGSQYKMSELITASLSEESTKVINISAATALDPNHQIRDAVCSAIASGRLVVAAAGNAQRANNCQLQNIFPASYNSAGLCDNGANLQEGLLTVGATDVDNNLAEWEEGTLCSNTLHVDVFAPGKDIYTASAIESYTAKDGTSYAAPIVAGAAAVLWASQPQLTVAQVHQQLLASSAKFGLNGTEPRTRTSDARVDGNALLDLFSAIGGEAAEPDVKPDAIASGELTDVLRDRLISFEPFTVTGIDTASPIDIEGGFYAIDDGPFRSAAAMVRVGQKVTVQVKSSNQYSSGRQAQLSIGGVIGTFSVVTEAADTRPDNFDFIDVADAAVGTAVLSNTLTIPGINTDTPISISGGEYALDGGAFTTVAGTVSQNQIIQLRVNASDTPESDTTATITIGGVSDTFTVTTEDRDIEPTPLRFLAEGDIALVSERVSNEVEIQGINTPAFISVSGGEYSIDGGAFTDDAGEIRRGQFVRVRQTSASTPETSTYTTLTVGSLDSTYRLTTLAADRSVDGFSFIDQTDIALGAVVISNAVTVAGVNTSVDVIVDGGEYRVNGGAFTSDSGQVVSGDEIELRLTAAATASSTEEATLTVGDTSDIFSVTTVAADDQPEGFTFIQQTDVEFGTLVTSNPITVDGINTAASIMVSGGEYQINGGAFSSDAGTVMQGDVVVLRVMSSAEPGSTVEATVTIGGFSDTFSVSTAGAVLPDAFGFMAQTGVEPDTVVTSEVVTITGLSSPVSISILDGEYAIDAGNFTAVPRTIANGQTVQVRVQAPLGYSVTRQAVLTIGGVSEAFSVTTFVEDTTPESFSFVDAVDAEVSTAVESNAVTIAGINSAAAISISAGEYRINRGAYTRAAGTVKKGDVVNVRLTSSAEVGRSVSATLTVGGVSDTFSVATVAADTTPDAFAFTAQVDVPVSSNIVSNEITVTGVNTDSAITITNGEYQINDGPYLKAAGVVRADDRVRVRVLSAADYVTTSQAVLSIGGVAATFEVTTDFDREPEPFSFTGLADQPWNSLITSNTVSISGIAEGTEIAVVGGEYSIDGGEFVAAIGIINAGQAVTLRLTSSGAAEATSVATLTVGSVARSFSVTTIAAEAAPPESAILFPPLSSLTERNTIVVRGVASDISGIATIDVNGTPADYDPETTSWQATVPLKAGDNTLTATIVDTQNNQSTHAVMVRKSPLGDALADLRVDAANNRFLAMESNELVAIDRDSGDIEVISGRGVPDNANLFTNPRDLQVSADGTRALVLESPDNIDVIKEVNLLTGERKVISQDETTEPDGTYHGIYDLVVHPSGSPLFVADSQGLIELDLTNGTRRQVATSFGFRGLAWDSTNGRLIMTQRNAVLAFYPADASTEVLADNGMAISTSDTGLDNLGGIVLDESRNLAYTAGGSDTSTIIEIDLSSGSRRLVSDNTVAVDTSEVSFGSTGANYIALDRASNQVLVSAQGGVVGVDITSGTRSWIMRGLGESQGIEFLPETNTVIVLSRSSGILYSFALGDIEPTVISNNSLAVEESNATFGDAWAMALHPGENSVYIGDWETDSIFAVDFATGRRDSVSDNSDTGQDHTFISPVSMLWMENENRVLILDSGRRSIVEMNIDTAARSTLSSTFFPDTVNALREPIDMLLSPVTGEALVLDKGIPAVGAVNVNTGARSIFGDITDDYRTTWLSGMELNESDDSVLVYSSLDGISRLNADGSYEHLVNLSARQVLYDGDANSVLVLEHESSVADPSELVRLDITTGARTLIPFAPTHSGEVLLDQPVDVALDTTTNAAYVVDQDTNAILRISLQSGERTLFANNDIAQATSSIEFQELAGIGIDATNNRLLVGDKSQNALIAVDLTSASRTLITNDVTAAETSNVSVRPRSIAVDSAGEFAYMTDWTIRGVTRVDLATGERRIFSDNSIASETSDIDFSRNPTDVALDERNNRVLLTDQGAGAVIAVDLQTGARTEFISRNKPVISSIIPYYLVTDASSNRLIVIDSFSNKVYLADVDTGMHQNVFAQAATLILRGGLSGVDYNATNDTLVMVDGYRDAVIVADMQTGEQVVLSQ